MQLLNLQNYTFYVIHIMIIQYSQSIFLLKIWDNGINKHPPVLWSRQVILFFLLFKMVCTLGVRSGHLVSRRTFVNKTAKILISMLSECVLAMMDEYEKAEHINATMLFSVTSTIRIKYWYCICKRKWTDILVS